MSRRSVAFFEVGGVGHFQRLRPLISMVVERGWDAHVFTHARFEEEVARLGGRFVDLFRVHPLDEADDASSPLPSRHVSFAGHFGAEIAEEAAAVRPSVVVADTFAVVGRVVARVLGVPHVNVCAGHNAHPSLVLPELRVDPRVDIADACHEAVDILRDRFGMTDASPFSYADGLSPWLNIYCEPPQYLTEQERAAFEPVAFFGSLPGLDEIASRTRPEPAARAVGARDTVRVYASCGTVVWRYYTSEALSALGAIAEALSDRPGCETQITLGKARVPADAVRALERTNVTVARYVDQWSVLREADVFITHHGLNSTHEAVFSQVPMISYPFFGDQPGLATRCAQLDLAVPLAPSPRAPITPDDVIAALERVEQDGDRLRDGLRRAHRWELEVIESRGAVVDQVLALG